VVIPKFATFDYFSTLESIHTIKKIKNVLVVAGNEIGLEVYAEKPQHMVMSRDHHAGRSHSIKNDDISFERVEELKYLGTNLTY
jgi:hypothetical protein